MAMFREFGDRAGASWSVTDGLQAVGWERPPRRGLEHAFAECTVKTRQRRPPKPPKPRRVAQDERARIRMASVDSPALEPLP